MCVALLFKHRFTAKCFPLHFRDFNNTLEALKNIIPEAVVKESESHYFILLLLLRTISFRFSLSKRQTPKTTVARFTRCCHIYNISPVIPSTCFQPMKMPATEWFLLRETVSFIFPLRIYLLDCRF